MSKKVGLLDQEEKEALEGEKYDLNNFFTPEEDADIPDMVNIWLAQFAV